MSLHTWWLYISAVFLICAVPGPNMLHVMVRSARMGVGRSIPAMAGCLVALELMLSISAIGLGAVLTELPSLFDAIRYAGAAYLLYLGIRAWRGSKSGSADPSEHGGSDTRPTRWRLFRGGLMVGLTNPKAILFATAFLPQFIDLTEPKAPQLALLVLTFAATEIFWYGVYGAGGQGLARYLGRPIYRRLFDRVTGSLFMGFGVALIRARL